MNINDAYKNNNYPTKVGQVFLCPFGSGEEYKVKSFDKEGFLATSVTSPHQIFRFKEKHFAR
tara:strand:- start:251 stop:436 length:186 start_codon:yes stop_codon:yes gene_type:complete